MMFPVGRYNRAAVAFIALTRAPAQGQDRFGIKHFCGLQYPRLAQLGVYSATVRLLAVIGDDGSVNECRELPIKELLGTAATESLRKWRFEACTQASSACTTEVDFIFRL